MQAKIRLHREGTHDLAKMKKHPEEAMTETRAEKKSDDRNAFTERTSTPKTCPRKTCSQAQKNTK